MYNRNANTVLLSRQFLEFYNLGSQNSVLLHEFSGKLSILIALPKPPSPQAPMQSSAMVSYAIYSDVSKRRHFRLLISGECSLPLLLINTPFYLKFYQSIMRRTYRKFELPFNKKIAKHELLSLSTPFIFESYPPAYPLLLATCFY